MLPPKQMTAEICYMFVFQHVLHLMHAQCHQFGIHTSYAHFEGGEGFTWAFSLNPLYRAASRPVGDCVTDKRGLVFIVKFAVRVCTTMLLIVQRLPSDGR